MNFPSCSPTRSRKDAPQQSPAVHFYMGNPVKRLLKRGVAAFCAKRLDFRMLSLHNMDHSTLEKRELFLERVRRAVGRL